MNKLTELAAKTKDCPACEGKGQQPMSLCQTCKGSGQLPLIAGLQQPCAYGCHERVMQKSSDSGETWEHNICPVCNDVRWTVVSEAEAFVAMGQWCLAQGEESTLIRYLPNPQIFVQLRNLGMKGSGKTPAEALADAILQAVEV